MDVYRRYFKIVEGPVIDAVNEAQKTNDAAHKQYSKILKEIGADPGYYHRDRRLTAIVFKKQPDRYLYKKKGEGWYPKKNCKAGKELAERIEAVETRNQNNALKLVGLTNSPTIFIAGRCYFPTLTVIPEDSPVVYISVPWYDEDPKEIERYKKERNAGTRGCCNLDNILWEPTPEMIEVKAWERDRHIDEWNEKIKTEKAA